MTQNWSGCGTALVTPFTASGAVDEPAVRRLAARQIDAGIHFLVPCGSTGESPTLSRAEQRRVVELVVDTAAGRVPVLAGAGGYDTRGVIELVADLRRAGANGILSVTPYYNKPTPEGLYQHYRAIADSTPLPIVVYNVPGRTGCNVDVDTLCRLAEIPNIVGVKEASANMPQMCEICRAVPTGSSVPGTTPNRTVVNPPRRRSSIRRTQTTSRRTNVRRPERKPTSAKRCMPEAVLIHRTDGWSTRCLLPAYRRLSSSRTHPLGASVVLA